MDLFRNIESWQTYERSLWHPVESKLAERDAAMRHESKELIANHVGACKSEVLRRLGEGKSEAERQTLEKQLADVFSIHQHFETNGQLQQRVEPAVPRYRELVDLPNQYGDAQGSRKGDLVYDVPICDGLKALVRDNPSILDKLRTASANWATPEPGDSVEIFCDIPDGEVLRNHPQLGIKADRSDGAVRLGSILYYDEVEVCNPLGAFAGTHKLGLLYWALIKMTVLWPQRSVEHSQGVTTWTFADV
jgi:hypothetical protein